MTNEEKIDMLCRLRSDIAVFIPRLKHQYCNALNEIIEELEQPSADCISRQAVLDILKDKWNMFSNANDAMQESIDTIEALLPFTPQQTRWIPCIERLPEKNGNYLVTVEANDGTASIKFQMVDHYGPDWLHEEKHEKVIAWMPLPESYNAESEDKE